MEEDFSKYNGKGTSLRKAQERLLEILIVVDKICRKHDIPYWIDGGTTIGAVRHGGFVPWDDDIDIALLRSDYLRLIKILPYELPDQFVLQNKVTESSFHMHYSRVVDKNSYSDYGDERVKVRKKFNYQGLFLDILYVEKGNLKVKQKIDYLYRISDRIVRDIKVPNSRFKKLFAYFTWPISILLVAFHRALSPIMSSENLVFGFGIPFPREFRKSEIFPVKPITFEGIEVLGPNDPHAFLTRYFGDYMTVPPPENRITHAKNIEVYD